MKTHCVYGLLSILYYCSWATLANSSDDFVQCLSQHSNDVYTPANSSFTSILQFQIRNLRFATSSTPKPLLIITPDHDYQIPPIIHCAKKTHIQIRTRSGGHDYEGRSYVAEVPFLIIDLINLSGVIVDVATKTAWVEAGATIGTLYYKIAEKSPNLGFPAGRWPTMGAGGHFSGGGYGTMVRKYGLSSDNIIDARIVDANGRILDRKSMGEDLFWAIRGGGGASFGVIVSWKIKLVDVPKSVTVFTVNRVLDQDTNRLIHSWQSVAPNVNRDLFLVILISRNNASINASFVSLFLGGLDRLLSLVQENFPELLLKEEDCIELSWIESVLYFSGLPTGSSPESLLNRTTQNPTYSKGKTDYIQEPISEHDLAGLWEHLNEAEGAGGTILMAPYGGRMAEIPDYALPFPHRAGNLYICEYIASWGEEDDSERYIRWVRKVYDYMTPYASKYPRGAYYNYRDLDIGVNNVEGKTSYEQASIWGKKYFENNFDRLVRVKTEVDPHNFFRNEQSIPPE